jgi:hypothetical protein
MREKPKINQPEVRRRLPSKPAELVSRKIGECEIGIDPKPGRLARLVEPFVVSRESHATSIPFALHTTGFDRLGFAKLFRISAPCLACEIGDIE